MLSSVDVVNPRRACCLCVCSLYHYRSNPSSLHPKSSTYRFIIGFCWILTRGFLKKPSVQELWHHLLTTFTAAQSMALFLTG